MISIDTAQLIMDNRQTPDDWTNDRDMVLRALNISLLGPVRITTGAGEDCTPPSKRGQALIAMVALSERGERTRGWLQAHLWSDRPTEQASASLRQELAKLRKLIGANHLVTEGDRIRLQDITVDVLELYHAGGVTCSFLAAETPDLLEGLTFPDAEFERWADRERQNWKERLGDISSTGDPAITSREPAREGSGGTARLSAPVMPGVGDAPSHGAVECPTLGLLPCTVRSSRSEVFAMADIISNLFVKTITENRTVTVFDFRDLSPDFSDGFTLAGKPARGPDLLASLQLLDVGGMIEIAVGVRRVENGRLIFTQSFSADTSGTSLLDPHRVAEFVSQAIESIEAVLLTDAGDDIRSASRLMLSAAHRVFCIKPTDLDVAERQLEESFMLDPSAVQLAWLAMLECIREGESDPTEQGGWTVRRDRVRELTARALELDRGNSLALALLGHANAFILRDYDYARSLLADSLAINRYRAITWTSQALLEMYSGEFEKGYENAMRGRSLGRASPYGFWYDAACGIGAGLSGRHSEAVRFGRRVMRQRPDFKPILRHLFASEAAVGDVQAAALTLGQLTRLEPQFDPKLLDPKIYPLPSARSIDLIKSGLESSGIQISHD